MLSQRINSIQVLHFYKQANIETVKAGIAGERVKEIKVEEVKEMEERLTESNTQMLIKLEAIEAQVCSKCLSTR